MTIVRKGRTRDEFDRFVAESVDGLLRAAYLIVWDVAEAEDLVQECFFRVARRWPRVRAMEHRRAYARKILVNLALDASGPRRRAQSELDGGLEHLAQHADDSAVLLFGRVEAGTDLVRALGELAPRQRAALVLRYFEDLTEAQVADVMACSVGTVKSTTARALERLRGDAGLQDGDRPADEMAATSTNGPKATNTQTATSERSITR
jgi:RNA polymerase sigma-70 factor (sigma-E family)